MAVGALWIVIGYAFYCTAYAAAGSLVTKPSDASNASTPVQLPLIVSYILTFTVLYGDSVYGFYWFLAFFPPTAPVSMTVLVAVGVAQPWQVALSMLICVASTAVMAWAAGQDLRPRDPAHGLAPEVASGLAARGLTRGRRAAARRSLPAACCAHPAGRATLPNRHTGVSVHQSDDALQTNLSGGRFCVQGGVGKAKGGTAGSTTTHTHHEPMAQKG